MPVTYFPFSAFRPDGTAYGTELDRLVNAIPWNGGGRSLRKMQSVATKASAGPVKGAYVHIFQADNSDQIARPDADTTAGVWVPSVGTDLFAMVDEASHDDSDYISAGGAPTNQVVKLSLSDVSAAALTSGHVVNWRYRLANLGASDAWEIICRIVEGTTTLATQTVSGTGNTAGVLQTQLAPATVTVTDYTNLFLEFEATAASAAGVQKTRPASDSLTGGWSTQAGGTSNLYQQIDEASASDADYVQGPAISVGGSATYRAKLGSVTDPVTAAGHVIRYRYRATNSGVTVEVKLKQGASTTIATWTHTNAATTLSTAVQALTTAQADAITDYADLHFEVTESYPTSTTSTATQAASVNGDISVPTSSGVVSVASLRWRKGSSGNWYKDTEAAGGTQTTSVSSAGTADAKTFELAFPTVSDPLTDADHKVLVRAARAPSGAVDWELRQSSTVIYSGSTAIDGTLADHLTSIPEASAALITNYALLRFFIRQPAATDIVLDHIQVQAPEPRRAIISWVELEVPAASRVDIMWAEMRTPASDLTYRGDDPTIVAGTDSKLYVVDGAGFTDLSGAVTFGAGGVAPGGWRFCSFGNNVVATNFVDPVQYRANNAGNFVDMMTSTAKPKARFVAPARDHLMLAGIDDAASDSAGVWWSALDNIRDFDVSVTTQCDRRKLYSTPGQCMGLVGGDFVRVWKRNSMYIGLWVGEDIVWRFDQLSHSIGTPCPSSIAEGRGEVMFWGGDSFYRQVGMEEPQAVGRGVLSAYLTDVEYSAGHIKPLAPTALDEEDQIMIGAFDPLAGVYVWIYQGPNDPLWRHSRAVVYSPGEDRWALFELPGDVSTIIRQPNTSNAQTHVLRGLLGFTFDGTDSTWFRFDDLAVYEQTYRTKIFPIALDDDDRPRPARIRGILPIFSAVSSDAVLPALTIKLEGAFDGRFGNPIPETYSTADVDHRNMFPFDRTGLFWKITVTVPETSGKAINALDGLYIDWEPMGED